MNTYLIGLDDAEFFLKPDGTAWTAVSFDAACVKADELFKTTNYCKIDIEIRNSDGETVRCVNYYEQG